MMKKLLQKRCVLTAVLVAAVTLAGTLGAAAAPSAVYQSASNTISVTGTEAGSKASLIVFSPKYNMSTMTGIEYFDVQDVAQDGSFTFNVPELSEANKAYGNYLCRVDIFGGDEVHNYSLNVYYPWGDADLTKLRRFDYKIEEETVSATAWFSDTWQLNPNYRVIIGLYKEDVLLNITVAGALGSASSATGWYTPLTATIAKDSEADTMKAYLMDMSNLRPQITCIEVPLNQ